MLFYVIFNCKCTLSAERNLRVTMILSSSYSQIVCVFVFSQGKMASLTQSSLTSNTQQGFLMVNSNNFSERTG